MTLHGTYIEGEPMEGITPGMLNRIEVSGQKIVLPTHDPQRIQLFNEYTLNPNRCTLVETPWGGLKGSSLPDNSVGTVRIVSGDGCYLSDINGNNVSKTLQSGKLAELGHLSVDTTNHTITEEFVIQNTGSGSDVQVINACDSTTGWLSARCTTSIDTVDKMEGSGALKVTCAGTDPFISYNCNLNLSTVDFITVYFKARSDTIFNVYISSVMDYTAFYRYDMRSSSDGWQKYVIPIKRPSDTVGSVDLSAIKLIRFGAPFLPVDEVFHLDDITACNGTWAQVEVAVPDILGDSDYATVLSCYGASAYTAYWRGKLNGSGVTVATSSAELKTLDATSFDDIYGGSQLGRGVYAKGEAGEVKQSCGGVAADITYSSLAGTSKRIGLAVCMPPSDNGRTEINKVRLRLVTYYDDENGNTVPDLSGNNNTGTILANVSKTSDSYLFGSVNTAKAIEHATITHSAGTIEFITDVMRGSKNGWNMIASFGGAFTKGWYIGWESNTLKVKVNDGVASKMAQWDDLTPSTRKTIQLLIDQVAKTIIVYADGNIVINDTFPLVGDITPVASTPFLIGSDGISTDSFRGAIYSYSLYYDGYKVLDVVPTLNHMGAVTHEFSNDNDLSTGLYHLAKPWVGLLNEATGDIEYFVFSDHPDALQFTQNDAGEIYEIAFDPGNGNVSHGIIRWVDQSIDSDSDYIPDCLDEDVEASLADMLHTTDFITILNTVYDLSTSSVVPNDFSITADDIDCFPFAVSYGNSVTDGDNNPLTPIEIVSTATGDVAIYDVKGHPTIKVHDAPGNNAGDCMVWDTVTSGNTNESTWVRVYDVNHVFTGDCVVENGLIRAKCGDSLWIFYYNTNGWKRSVLNRTNVAANIISINADEVKFVIKHAISKTQLSVSSIKRGSSFIEHVAAGCVVDNTALRWAVTNDVLFDGKMSNLTSGQYKTIDSSPLYNAGIDTTLDNIPFVAAGKGSAEVYVRPNNEGVQNGLCVTDPTRHCTGIIQYPMQTYFEAESLNFASNSTYISGLTKPPILPNELYTVHIRAKNIGATSLVLRLTNDQCATMYTGEDCYPFSGNTGVTLGSHIVKEVTFSEIGSEFGYGKADIMLTQEELDRVTSWHIVAPEANSEFILDYVLFVPTGMLDRYAKRSLVNLSPMTSTIEKTTR